MEGSSKIALAIVAAAVLLVLGYVGYDQWQQHRAAQAMAQAMQQVADQTADMAAQQEQAVALQHQRAEAARLEWHSRRQLTGTLRCVGGAVVDVQGTSYRQVGTIANPVHCVGDMADRPLR